MRDLPNSRYLVRLASPEVPWSFNLHDEKTVARWAAAVSAVPYTKEVGQSVVDALLQIAHIDSLRPYIPIYAWAWLKKSTSLLPLSEGRLRGNEKAFVHHVRALGDIEILKSYFLLAWSELGFLDDSCFAGMQVSIREDSSGIGMGRHRKDLIEQLEQRLEDLEEFSSFIDGVGEAQRETEQY